MGFVIEGLFMAHIDPDLNSKNKKYFVWLNQTCRILQFPESKLEELGLLLSHIYFACPHLLEL